jgi:ubiquinone/menaquinone biosynthesis C-methylase UbiE
MTNSEKTYQEAIEANIAVHSAMADEYNTAEPHFREESINRVKSIVAETIKRIETDSVLDLGCGTGFMINILKSHFKNIVGVDVTQAMMDKVDKSGNSSIQLINSDTGSVELPKNHFDFATAYTFLDHLYDMNPTFQNCYNSLKKGGLFYADLSPNAYFWDEIKGLDQTKEYDEIIKREIRAVTAKDEEIEAQFGVKKEVFTQAEHQKHVEGGLREEKVKADLEAVGFKNIQFIYHWYVGQAQLINDESLERKIRLDRANTMHKYLVKSLPLSRHLFKYIGFIAEK